jgi:hypothetical protein
MPARETNVDPLPQTAAREPVLVRHADKRKKNKVIMKTMAYTDHFYTTPDPVRPPGAEIEEGNQLCLLETGNPSGTTECDIRPQEVQGEEKEKEMKIIMTVASRPPTAAREPVGIANVNINDGIMKTFLRYYTSPSGNPNYTSPNRVRPPGAEIEQDIGLTTSFSNQNALTIPSQTVDDAHISGNECGIPSGSRGSGVGGRGHFITRFLTTTGPADVPDTGKNLESSSWTSLLTQSMSILGGGYGNKNFSENNDSNLSVLNL